SARTLTATVWLLLSVTLQVRSSAAEAGAPRSSVMQTDNWALYKLSTDWFTLTSPGFRSLSQANAQLANCSAPRPGGDSRTWYVSRSPDQGCLCGQDVQQSCGDGLVCSQPTSVALASDAEAGSVPFLCIPCVFGQYCPEGTALPAFRDPGFQTAMKGLECRSGFYCPSPLAQLPCPQGAFCGPGSVAPTTCAMDELLRTSPNMELPQRPTTVYSSVYVDGDTLGGNYCPANSSTPSTQCAGGTYCPSPGLALPCPKGSFCKPGSKDPSPCPFLTSCPPGSSKAALSWTGFILLAGILLGLLAAYCTAEALMRMAQRRQLHTQEARDRLWKLLNPLGEGSFRAFNSIRPRLHIEFRNLGLELHDGRTILSGVTGRFEHSKVSAVMGPSGAGKTTFLSVLMGQSSSHGKTMGSLRINGRSVGIPDLQSVVGFVPQEDLVHEDLTVRENLVYSARLRLSTSKPRQEQMDIVDDVLDVLQLRHVQHQIVGSVERRGIRRAVVRKRVSIGLELAAKPSILFMDEPTSGLDATAAADILQLSRAWGTKFLDLLLLVFAGIVTGAMHGTGWTNWDFKGHIALIMLTLGIIAASGALAVFGKERLVHWRERESGVRVFSYFMANSTTNMVDVFIQPLVFLSVYYSMTIPSISFGLLYVIGVLVVFWCASLGCLMSIIMGNNSALVASVAILMVIGGFINGVNPVYRSLSPLLKGITVLSYNRWAADAAAIWDFREQPPWQWPLTRSIMFASGQCGLDSIEEPTAGSGLVPEALLNMSLDINVYCAGEARKGLLILGAQGLILRMLAFFALLWCPRGISFDPLIRWVSRGVTRVTKPLRRHTKTTSTHPVQLMFSPLPLKTDFGEHLLTPFTSLFSPKGFSLTSPLAANLFEDFAVKDGHLSFDNLDSVAPTNKKKRKFDGLLATDFGSLSDSLPPAQKLCLTPFPDLTYTRPVVQYGRIRAMEAEVRELEQSIAEMEAAIEQAESQGATALHTPRQPDAAPQALPRLALPEPDLASLATSFLSPGTEELFAAACNMRGPFGLAPLRAAGAGGRAALKRMAGLGMNVIAVLHQPRFSIFALFDDIMLLGKGGRLVYLGPSWLAMPYFESLDFELPLHENPADFVMDVISGSVPQRGCDAFHPERLVGLWQTYGLSWVRTQSKLMPLDPTYGSRPPEQLRIDPEQFALLSEQFDAADADGDDALRAGDLQVLLRALGLEPSTLDIQMIMAELAIPRTGLVSKEAFMQYVQYGGRPPASAPDGPPSASGRRAVQSIYRVYSIEQYTLSAAIAELSAAALPSGLRPAGNLKELASAVVAGGELGRSRGGRGDAGGGA
ncbi:hypothetical protein APUTEX25_001981, partial [Auxenochlorella protothecoides]